jgi:hypothetical protein
MMADVVPSSRACLATGHAQTAVANPPCLGGRYPPEEEG